MKTKILFIASLVAVTIFSCSSPDKTTDDTNTSASVSSDQVATDAKIDASINDVSNIAEDQFSIKQNSTSKSAVEMKSMLPTSAIVTWAHANGNFTATIDFGTTGSTLPNGNVLKGKIIISFSDNLTTTEQTISYTLDGFYHNGRKIEGNKTITRSLKSTTLLAAIHPVFTCTVDLKVTFEDGTIYTRSGTRVRELVEGYDTLANWNDNVYLVTGVETTTQTDGDTWSSTIQTPLRYVMSCQSPFPVSGTVLKVKNGIETLVDFGNGDCDNIVKITIAGVTTTLELKK